VECRREHRVLAETSSTLREGLVRHPAPDVLKARLRSALAQAQPFDEPVRPRRRQWMSLAAAGVAIAIASSGITLAVARRAPEPTAATEVLAGHLRSLMPGHLTDVASTNQHNVKPWFNGRLDYSPTVPRLEDQGFPLVGGRVDYVGGRPVAVIVYSRRQHMINVFSWPTRLGDSPLATTSTNGYNMIHWRSHGVEKWVVSDLNSSELRSFVDLLLSS
jgi:anti-sigma factor RsiW